MNATQLLQVTINRHTVYQTAIQFLQVNATQLLQARINRYTIYQTPIQYTVPSSECHSVAASENKQARNIPDCYTVPSSECYSVAAMELNMHIIYQTAVQSLLSLIFLFVDSLSINRSLSLNAHHVIMQLGMFIASANRQYDDYIFHQFFF